MLDNMSKAQRSMLQAAAQREDRCFAPPAKARKATVEAFASSLIGSGWAQEVKAREGAPVWRIDEASGANFALKLTAKGVRSVTPLLKAADANGSKPKAPSAIKTAAVQLSATAVDEREQRTAVLGDQPPLSQTRAPRASSKLGRVIDLLTADSGATIAELTETTGWLEHTTRAALTGLRHRGYELSRARKERDGASVYRIVA